jgi:hypothetical protein
MVYTSSSAGLLANKSNIINLKKPFPLIDAFNMNEQQKRIAENINAFTNGKMLVIAIGLKHLNNAKKTG